MVHNQSDALLVGVAVQCGQVEVGIGSEEVENIVFLLAVPVLPADVPTLDEQCVEAVGGGKVDIAAYVLVVGGVAAVRGGMLIIGDAQLDGGEIIGVTPAALVGNHFPPYAHILHGVDPRHIFQHARVVEVEDEA